MFVKFIVEYDLTEYEESSKDRVKNFVKYRLDDIYKISPCFKRDGTIDFNKTVIGHVRDGDVEVLHPPKDVEGIILKNENRNEVKGYN